MRERQNIEQVNSINNHHPQHLLSLSASKSQLQKLDSHIKSSLAHLQGKQNKKYLYVKVHNSFLDLKDENCKLFLEMLKEQFDNKAEVRFFKETRELLADNYDDNELHYIIVPEKELSWAQTFAKQEREESNNKKKINVYGILKKKVYLEKMKARSKKKLEKIPDYIHYYAFEDEQYPEEIVRMIEGHLEERIRQEGNHVKTWAQTNKFAGKSVKRRTLHFYYEPRMEKELQGMYLAYKKKAKSAWIQIYKYESFEDILKKIRQRSIAFNKEVETAKQVTSRILKSTSQIEAPSMKSVFMQGAGSQMNSSILSSSIRAINKLDQNDVNIVIVNGHHPEMEKFRALVRAQKYGNWFLWEIEEGSSDFFEQLKDFLNQEVKSNEEREMQEYERIIHSKSLIILALVNDSNTIDMFNSQQNVLHNMQLLLYNDSEEFSVLLREGVRSSDDFVIAVVPGGFKSFATEYARVIAEFDAKYKNVDCVQNFKFISNANGRHVSNIASSNLLGTQSNLTYFQDNTYLQNIMRDRDKHFHPLEGLKGHNVYLLIKETIQSELHDLRDYISRSSRLQISAYIDKEFLKQQIEILTLKDSVLIITNDTTLREAQAVARRFDEVSILNITDRENAKEEIKVICSGKRAKIYELIQSIPEVVDNLQSQIYEQTTPDESYTRKNRIMPKKITFRPGDTISIRLPANLKDEESHKMEIRLQRFFNQEIKIEYYKEPKDVRLINKLEQPLAFIVWADKAEGKEEKEKRRVELQYFKQMAQNQQKELREEFLVYSDQPKQYTYLTTQPAFQRFKFVSSRWQRIEQYIIGAFKNFLSPQGVEDSIFSDEKIRVFFNDKDKSSKDLISTVMKRRDGDEFNAANHIQFHLIDDLQTTLQQQSPYHKYYIVFNEESENNKYSKSDLLKMMDSQDYRHIFIRMILIQQDKAKKIQAQEEKSRRVFPSEASAGEWLCKIKVNLADLDFIMPHILIDRTTLDYFYFLDKYSALTRRFSFAFCPTKEEAKAQVLARKDRASDQVWILVKDMKAVGEYSRYLQRCQNFKNVRFVGQFGDNLTQAMKPMVVFKHEQRKEVEKFLLNIYRRDKSVFFPSSVRVTGQVILVIMNGVNGKPIPINKQQKANWQDILNAKILYAKDIVQLTDILKQSPNDTIYVVYAFTLQKQLTSLCSSYKSLKRVPLVPFPEYDPRRLRTNFVDNNNKIYIGTYPAEITDYLRVLRYNIRKSQEGLQKKIKHELIEINIQKDYKLSEQELAYLTAKNDSIIVNTNGYDLSDLPALLDRANKFNYLMIFIGDQQSGKAVGDFNEKKGKQVQFIDVKASPLLYMRGEKSKHHLLQTNERQELITFLYNIPQNRYAKAINNRGKFILYCNSEENSLYPYLADLKEISERNPKIQVRNYSTIGEVGAVKESIVILINGQSEKEYMEKVKPVSNINYMITNEEYSKDKNYASYGNKYFIAKRNKEFSNFMNQIATNYDPNLQPISLQLDNPTSILSSIANLTSKPISAKFCDLKILPPFKPKPAEQIEELVPVELKNGVIDGSPPTLLTIQFPSADLPSLPLGIEILKKIIDASVRNENQILKPGLDAAPAQNWFNIKSEPDSFSQLPKSIQIPKPAPPMKLKLAILHPNTKEFARIGQMLKRNLEPQQFAVTLIQFKSQHQLQEYSKNNGQRLNGYDKIVVFLSNAYRKYDSNLRLMKSKLNNRMEYFIFDDNFYIQNHSLLRNHLRPYRIKPHPLPYANYSPSKHLQAAQKIIILVPPNLVKKYEGLKSGHVSVVSYKDEGEAMSYLHKEGCFILLITPKENYHKLKLNAKVTPRCMLIVDTGKDLPDDQLQLYRISTYALYYGPDANEYLRKILPNKPSPSLEELKFLFFSPVEEELVFESDYDDYERVFFNDWRELYQLLMFNYKDKSNWLIKHSPGKPEIVALHPKAYLENKQYMKDFKNSFAEKGYLNEERVARKSTLVLHQYADLPEVYYADEKELIRWLEKQEAPSVVLYDAGNRRVEALRGKFARHKWVGLTDNSERWINPEGELPEVQDDRLIRKQDMFTNMFNNRVFDEFNDMQYYYLSNKAHVDHNRNIYFRNKEQLLSTYDSEPNLLMVVFVEAKDIAHVPQALLAESSEGNGRVKLILLKIDFVDDYDTLYIKFNEIDPVIKHINAVESAGRIDFIVYNESDGERTRQTLIQRRKLRNFDNRPYSNFIDIEDIGRNIKGRYKKVYVVCFPDQRQQIQNIFTSYGIQNKGIPNEGVEFILIDRLSAIRPNPSYLSNIHPNKTPTASTLKIARPDDNTLKPESRDSRANSRKEAAPVVDTAAYGVKQGRNNTAEEYLQKEKNRNDYIEQQQFQLPNTQSNIKPSSKMDHILANKNYVLNVDEKLKNLFPADKFPSKVRYFTNPNTIPQGGAQLIISSTANPDLVSLSEEPDNFVVVVGKGGKGDMGGNNTLVIGEEEVADLIQRLRAGSNIEEQLSTVKNIEDFEKVRVVYDKDMDIESKRRLLAVSQKNKRIYPTMFKGVGKLKDYMQEPDSLLLLMMSYDPENLEAAVAQQNRVIVKKRRVKVIVPRKAQSDVDGLQTILEEQQADQQNEAIKKLTNQQVDLFLKIYQNTEGDRPPVTQPDEWQGEREYGEAADLDNITKLNVHSNIRPQNLFRDDEIDKIKQRLTGDLIVLVIDSGKREQVDEAVGKYNVLVQAYTNSMNLENDIRDRKDNVTLAVIDRNMLDKIPQIKKKYPHAAFILEADAHDDGIEQYRPYLAGQIRKMADLEKIIADLYQQNERIRYNAESVRAASRFEMKKTSMVDVSNNERFTVGLSNQKAKKVFLFYKDPENLHVKTRLSDTFNNINFIAYKTVPDFKRLSATYNTYSSILIANGTDIPELQDFVSKKKEMIYVIRFNPPSDLRDNPKVKKLFSTYKRDDLEKFIFDEFQRNLFTISDFNSADARYRSPKNAEGKRYIQKYEPNTFGTTPRFPGDFVPPKSKESTYSRKYMKSTSRSKLSSRLQALSPKGTRNLDYFQP